MTASTPRTHRSPRKRAKTIYGLTSYAEQPDPAISTDEAPAPLPTHWSGVIGMEDDLTGDGRLIEGGALEWETPVPLRFVLEDTGGHEGAVTVGRILTIERGEGGKIIASGDFDLGSEVGQEAARLVGNETMNGVSMDLDSVAFEVRVARELLGEEVSPDDESDVAADDDVEEAPEDGGEADEDTPEDAAPEAPEEPEIPELEVDGEGRVIVAKLSSDDELMVTTSARIRGATLVSIPAFVDAKIFTAEPEPRDEGALVASAAPIEPPKDWFFTPEADKPTALTITDEGQVYGHLATWDTCHVADPSGAGVCVMAPKSTSGYAYFHTGAVKTAEGVLVPTGSIRFNTGHASMRANASDAVAHYDNTGLAGADIHAVDGKYGIWVAGALRPSVTAEQIRTLRASPLSGDWRYVQGKLELVGALAVNLPGFPIPRTAGLVASGEIQGLVAAGMIAPEESKAVKQFSDSDAAYLQKLINREKHYEQQQLATRVAEASRQQRIESLAAKLRAEAIIRKGVRS